MKKYVISIVSILVALVVISVSFAPPAGTESRRSGRGSGRRRWMTREEQLKVIATVQEELAKMKSGLESFPAAGGRQRWQGLSEEERNELRGKFRKIREERQQSIAVIEEQIAKLKGERHLRAKHEESISKLKAIHQLAVKEKATETAASIEKLIAEQQKEFEESLPSKTGPKSKEQPVQHEAANKAPAFRLKSFDGKTISLPDYEGKIVVLEWFNYECPFVKYHYEQTNTMVELANKYKDKNVVWLAVNSTSHSTVEKNNEFAQEHKLGYSILDDRSGVAGRAYKAKTTPHMFVIDVNGELVYEGAIDNSPMGRSEEELVNYVGKALAELTTGKAVSTQKTKPYGCSVKYAH